MKYILMMNTMKAGHGVPSWPRADLRAHVSFMMKLNKELIESGEFVLAEGLSFPDQAKQVRAGNVRGSLSQMACFLNPRSSWLASGSWMSSLPSALVVIAAQVSAAPGPGGAPLNMPIEVRQVMSAPPPEMM